MRAALCALLFFHTADLSAMTRRPWLGNLFELEGSIAQEHAQSDTISTSGGIKHRSLHRELTKAMLTAMPTEDLRAGVELDLAKTQTRAFGFDALKGAVSYSWLNDIAQDAISLTTGMRASLSTASRVADLSSQNHGVCELEANVAVGKEFGYSPRGYYRAWAAGYVGAAEKGSPWVGAECHLEHRINDHNTVSLFFLAEKGTSSHKLSRRMARWASVGYEWEDVGARYAFKKSWLGTAYVQFSKRIHAHFCPRNTWSVQAGVIIPFSIV